MSYICRKTVFKKSLYVVIQLETLNIVPVALKYRTEMRLCVALLCLALLQASIGHAEESEFDQSCHMSRQKDEECGMYAYHIIKPMMSYFDQVNQLLDKYNVEVEIKNSRISELVEEVNRLRVESASCTSKDKIIRLHEEKDQTNVDLIKSLKQQMSNQCEKQNIDLKSNTEELKTCEQELQNQKKIIIAKDLKIQQLQMESKETKQRDSCISKGSPGVHSVTVSNNSTFDVLCNFDISGGGWTVIQQRLRGGVDFNRDWSTYQNGFGLFWNGDFFLGLEKIHLLTSDQPHELYIHMQRFDDTTFYARYDEFAIAGEEDQYKITQLGRFSGSVGTTDEMSFNKNCNFSTFDRDNDKWNSNCARYHEGGWWYNACSGSFLNGKYVKQDVQQSIFWGWKNLNSLKQVRMMIRQKGV